MAWLVNSVMVVAAMDKHVEAILIFILDVLLFLVMIIVPLLPFAVVLFVVGFIVWMVVQHRRRATGRANRQR